MTRTPESKCPTCGHKLDAATAIEPSETTTPKSGDYNLCIQCGELLCFNDDLTLRKATDTDKSQMSDETRGLIIRGQLYIRGRGK